MSIKRELPSPWIVRSEEEGGYFVRVQREKKGEVRDVRVKGNGNEGMRMEK